MYLLYLCESEFGTAKDLRRPGAAQDYLWPSLQSHNERYTFVNLRSNVLVKKSAFMFHSRVNLIVILSLQIHKQG